MRKNFSRLWIVFWCLFCLGLNAATAVGQEPAAEEKQAVEETFPGVQEIVPRSTVVAEEAVQAKTKLSSFQDLAELEKTFQALKKDQEEINKLGNEVKDIPHPNYDKMLFFRNKVTKQSKSLEGLLSAVSNRLAEVDTIG